ncbi:hypothetical protein ScalyP_jg1359 [Parmales sp. scaly parma]|nr:hypothetical protein ScalyP_jg1359 [Parmales sp. scaly parma]
MAHTTFTATDGKVFTDRQKYRLHEFETQYTFRNKMSGTHTKPPNTINGQAFDISDCSGCNLQVLDHTDMCQIDNVKDSKIFIAAANDSVFVRDCSDCVITIACKQLRTRDCHNCTFYLYAKTEPIIETSSGMQFAPFNGAFKGHERSMLDAGLIPTHNLWFAVYDFNDDAKTGNNWKIMDEEKEEKYYNPLNDGEANCCPRVAVGSIALPSQQGDDYKGPSGASDNVVGPTQPPPSNSGMKSFDIKTGLHAAAVATGDLFVAQETAPGAGADSATKPKPKPAKTSVGWNPDASSDSNSNSISKSPSTNGSSIGWNANAFAAEPSDSEEAVATSYVPTKDVQEDNKAKQRERYEKVLKFMEAEGVSIDGFVGFLVEREEEASGEVEAVVATGEQAIDFSIPPPSTVPKKTTANPKISSGVSWTG